MSDNDSEHPLDRTIFIEIYSGYVLISVWTDTGKIVTYHVIWLPENHVIWLPEKSNAAQQPRFI
jgi:hypothetical protein